MNVYRFPLPYMAMEFNTASATLIGFNFDDDTVTNSKARKLGWARKLIEVALG